MLSTPPPTSHGLAANLDARFAFPMATAPRLSLRDPQAWNSTCPQPIWQALACGQYGFVGLFEHEGQRRIALCPRCPSPHPAHSLSPVEARAAQLAGQAFTNKEIALALHTTESAAENQLSRALRKMGISNRILLVTLYTWLEEASQV